MAAMDRNNLTALLTALAIVPLYFKEPSQPAPEKWEMRETYITRYSDGTFLLIGSSQNGTRARIGPTGDWVVSKGGKILSRHDEENEAYRALLNRLHEAEDEIMGRGFEPFAVETAEFSNHIHYRRRVQ